MTEENTSKGKILRICISTRTYEEIMETLPANISIELLINKLLKAWNQDPSSKEINKNTKEERKRALEKSAKETVAKKIKEVPKTKRKEKRIKPISVQVTKHVMVSGASAKSATAKELKKYYRDK